MNHSAGTCRLLLPQHPLAGLQSRSALFARWPTLCVEVDSPQAATDAQRAAAQILGPLPQAELLEDDDGSGTLRIPLPELDATTWATLDAALRDAGHAGTLVPLADPGAQLARDLGDVDAQPHSAGGLTATVYQRHDAPGAAPLDLAPVPMPAGSAPLALDLVHALVEADPTFALTCDDDVQAVVHRPTGRLGLRVGIPLPALEEVSPEPEALAALYDRAIGAVAKVVTRHQHRRPALAPDLVVDPRWGLSILAWLVRPSAAPLPRDPEVGAGLTHCGALHEDPLVQGMEIQVVPGPSGHDAVVDAMVALGEAGLPIRGAEPRWLQHHGQRRFTPTWRCNPEDADAIGPALSDLDAAAVRIVPGPIAPLAETWYRIDPAWIVVDGLVVLRARDGAADKDWLPPVQSRPAERADHHAQADLTAAMGAGWVLRPVLADRPALRLDLPLGSLAPAILHTAIADIAGALASTHVGPLAMLAWTRTGATLHLWCADGTDPA